MGRGRPPSYILAPPVGGTIAYLYARLVPGEGLSPAVRYCPRCRFAFGVGCSPSRFVLVLIVRGGFVCPICWLACVVAALVFVLFLRWFRLPELLVRVWCWSFWRWFRSFCLCGGFVSFAPWVSASRQSKSAKFET